MFTVYFGHQDLSSHTAAVPHATNVALIRKTSFTFLRGRHPTVAVPEVGVHGQSKDGKYESYGCPDPCYPGLQLATEGLLQLCANFMRAHREREAHHDERESDPPAKDADPAHEAGWAGHHRHSNAKREREQQEEEDGGGDADKDVECDAYHIVHMVLSDYVSFHAGRGPSSSRSGRGDRCRVDTL
ncbi:hypothetical protein ACQRIT_000045 [Beauveria bassiana]